MAEERRESYRKAMADEQTCPRCGAVYRVRSVKVPFRDNDSYTCACGETLGSWNGSRIQQFELLKPGNPDAQRT